MSDRRRQHIQANIPINIMTTMDVQTPIAAWIAGDNASPEVAVLSVVVGIIFASA